MPFTVYRSSAGSGKTFTLVLEYLQLVLKWPDNYRHILALTFTNKAANEMKDRVLQYLDLLAGDGEGRDVAKREQILKLLSDSTGLSHNQIKIRANDVLLRILHNFSDFSIATIDSFNHRIVRTFAYDLFLSSDFEIELEQSVLIDQAIDELMSLIGINEELTRVLIQYSLGQSELDKSWNIEKSLKETANMLFKEDGRKKIAGLSGLHLSDFQNIQSRLQSFLKQFEKKIRDLGLRGVNLMEQHNLSPDDFVQKGSGPGKYFYNLRDYKENRIQQNSYVRKAREEGKFLSSTASRILQNTFEPLKNQFIDLLQQVHNLLDAEYPRVYLYQAILNNLNQMSVLTEIDRIVSSVMKEQNKIHISEFNRRIESIVKNESTPFIYVRLGDKYTSFLMDEFQDTSLLQWQNLLPLVNNSLAEDHFNLIVGDGKQAIYRWRSGEVEQFSSLPVVYERPPEPQFSEYEKSLTRHYIEKNLSFNYRTSRNIVEFNNRFFELAAADLSESLKRVYFNHKQAIPGGQDGGYVRIDLHRKKKSEGESFEEFNTRCILRSIEECLADGYDLSDIVILTRTNKHCSEAARILTENGFQIQSSESVLLGNAVVIKFLIACLKHLSYPNDPIAEAVILRYCAENNLPANHWSEFNKRNSGVLSVLELVENIARYFHLFTVDSACILRFFDLIHEFMSRSESDLLAFMDFWDEKKKSTYLVSAGRNAIRLMTIHKAKGLEFPVVIFPYANLSVKVTKDIWVNPEDELIPELKVALVKATKGLLETSCREVFEQESNRSTLDLLNMVYVAFTRPVYRLYVVSARPPESRTSDGMTLPALLEKYLGIYPEEMKEDFAEIGGRSQKRTEKQAYTESEKKLESIISEDWRNRLFIRQLAPEGWSSDNPDKKRHAGIVIHNLLSTIKGRSDLKNSIEKLDPEEIPEPYTLESLSDQIGLILDHPLIGKYFDDGLRVYNECDILHPDGSVSRPDRAVVLDNDLIVLDYKTGKENDHHHEQMKQYIKTAREMGYRGLKAYLIYLNDEILVKEVSL